MKLAAYHTHTPLLGRGLHLESAGELADLVRMINSYYSNLIEGHNTRPKDIERALAGAEVERRTLALEAKAHVEVQREIDAMYRRRPWRCNALRRSVSQQEDHGVR